jgi:hypothetical protein
MPAASLCVATVARIACEFMRNGRRASFIQAAVMTSDVTTLVARVRAEFSEMPGLRLTLAQAARLWHLEPAVCGRVIAELLRQRFLSQTRSGAFVRADPS